MLPADIEKAVVPPIKCQGIKSRLVPFIARSVQWDGGGRWIEPFMGSGVVAFSLAPERALLCDVNPHLVAFYSAVQRGDITPARSREFLEHEGQLLQEKGEEHYYFIRERFNRAHAPLDFLFLSRACFNGMMRFNRAGGFNVPFCRKPERFRPGYVTRIVNQIEAVAECMRGRDWEFRVQPWRETLRESKPSDFVYLDPPYVGRHTNYFSDWGDGEADALASDVKGLTCPYALSMWLENAHRRNAHLDEHWTHCEWREVEHFYHVGASEKNRGAVREILALSP